MEAGGNKDIKLLKSPFYQHWTFIYNTKESCNIYFVKKMGLIFFQEKSLDVSSQRRNQNCQRYIFIRVYVLSHFSHAWLSVVACQAPLSMAFSRQECWSRLPCPPPGDLPNPGIKFVSLLFLYRQADFLSLAPLGSPICSYTFSL